MTDSLSVLRHLVDRPDASSTGQSTEFYRSSNGDLWELLRASAEAQCMVRHTPAPASGGQPSLVTLEAFLAVNCGSPEHGALRILLPGTRPEHADR
ncbi:MAG: hypothetical protein RQ966_06335 [Acetobacteraceae bacterium]|nr:hypothetical protein [Acetobacteraceae bacterium]